MGSMLADISEGQSETRTSWLRLGNFFYIRPHTSHVERGGVIATPNVFAPTDVWDLSLATKRICNRGLGKLAIFLLAHPTDLVSRESHGRRCNSHVSFNALSRRRDFPRYGVRS